MFRLTINNIPHLVVNDTALLIYAAWGTQLEMLLTQDTKFARSSLNEGYADVLKGPVIQDKANQTYRTFFGFQPANNLIDTETPKGIFVSLQYQGTVYRYLKWVFEYRGLLAPEPLLQALSIIATAKETKQGKTLLTYLPDPLASLQYDWKESSSKTTPFKQLYYYEGNGELVKRIGVTGHVTKESFSSELTGIQVKHAPPNAKLLNYLFLDPYTAKEKEIIKCL
jgi:hypothetical protein